MNSTAPLRVVELRFLSFRRLWRGTVLISFLQPILFLLGMGVGVGALVNQNSSSADLLGGVEYIAFLAPGLLATSAMITAANESMWPVMDSFRWNRAYEAMVTAPLAVRDVVRGEILWWTLRLLLTSSAIAVVLAVVPATRSWGLIPAVPSAVLCGLAFGVPIAAWSASRETDQSFPAINRFVITPLFLFGGAFYPIDQLPDAIQPVAWFTPLWHGVELCRGFALSTIDLGEVAMHTAALLVFVIGGVVACHRTYSQRLFA
jgi:lipooligosaccharide transport system permease protein